MDKDFLIKKAKELFRESSLDSLEPFPEEERQKYYKKGNRNDFEKLYFRRRDYLSSCALLSLFDEGYIPLLEKIIEAICDEKCWALPAHVPGIEPIDKMVIDLFVAETAFALAEITTVLGDKLSEKIKRRVKKEVRERVNCSNLCGQYKKDLYGRQN